MSYLNSIALAIALCGLLLAPLSTARPASPGQRPLITCLNIQAPHLSPGYCRHSRVR